MDKQARSELLTIFIETRDRLYAWREEHANDGVLSGMSMAVCSILTDGMQRLAPERRGTLACEDCTNDR